MVERNDHHVAAAAQIFAVVRLQFLARTRGKSSAVQPHHHWPLPAVIHSGRPDVDAQTIFAGTPIVPIEHPCHFVIPPAARAAPAGSQSRTASSCAARSTASTFVGRLISRLAFRRAGVRNSEECVDAVAREAPNFARSVSTTAFESDAR